MQSLVLATSLLFNAPVSITNLDLSGLDKLIESQAQDAVQVIAREVNEPVADTILHQAKMAIQAAREESARFSLTQAAE